MELGDEGPEVGHGGCGLDPVRKLGGRICLPFKDLFREMMKLHTERLEEMVWLSVDSRWGVRSLSG